MSILDRAYSVGSHIGDLYYGYFSPIIDILGGDYQDEKHYRKDRPRLRRKHHGELLLSCRSLVAICY